jgi:anti-sigma factor RsiW
MTSCERAQTLFGRAWDDELTAVERDGLELHVKGCAGCRREYDEFARTLELVQALPRPAVSDDFAARVLVAAAAREREAAAAPRRIFAWPSLPSFEFGDIAFGRPALALAATFVVAVSAAVMLMRSPAIGPVQAPTVATVAPQAQSAPAAPVIESPAMPAPTMIAAADPAPVRRTPARAATNASVLVADAPTIPDSLFDHTADVELVLDPVKLRRERGVGYTPTSVRGEAASITF